ncbi:MAG TPA: hypothetical protein VNU44_15405 [Bryobacteraceae bacterium]|jgi:hypothetical protein|nr:hypothetical protein [Bryobacteraceae bacterium]
MSVEDGHEVIPADPHEGFDRAEPSVGAIFGFAAGSMILLVLTIFAIQQYFDHIWNQAVYEKVLAPPSEKLREVRGRDDWNLTHYLYMDKATGQVRIPVDQAMELLLKDAAAGKTFYPAKATVPKKEEPAAPVPGAPATTTPAPATPPPAAEKK